MSAILFYLNKNNVNEKGVEKIPTGFNRLLSINLNTTLYCSGKIDDIYKLSNERFDLFLIGNIIYHKQFAPNIDLLIQNHQINQEELKRIFKAINGIYAGFVFDKSTNQVYIITDYLGFYPLYFYSDTNCLIFSTELKHFKSFEKIICTIDEEAVFSYLHNGHLMLNQSWFQQVKRARPASVYTVNIHNGHIRQEYYWVWSRGHKVLTQKKEIIDTYAALFNKGIEHLNLNVSTSIGLSLSGGLESRWIAQTSAANFSLQAFTFSTGFNQETLLAKKVATALNINHQNPIIGKTNWLINRLQGFWKTDGMLHLGHLHETDIHDQTHGLFSHCFHGFYGGGIYTNATGCHNALTNEIVKKRFAFNKTDPGVDDLFYQTGCLNPYTGDNKIRYQSAYSIYLLSSYCKMILPFYNMDWLEFNFTYSVDDAFDGYSTLYLEVLNAHLQESLRSIPWQRTGLPPKYVLLNIMSLKLKLPSIFEAVHQKFHSSRHFINYNYFDKEIDYWVQIFKPDIKMLQLHYPLHSREQKLRMLSLVVWLRMLSKNSPDVL